MKYLRSYFSIALILFFFINLAQANAENRKVSSFNLLKQTKAPISKIDIINIFPHDPESFTQGLVYHRGYLYESTGLNSSSALKKIELNSGKVIKRVELGQEYFGEGIAILDNKIYQITWLNQTGFIYDLGSFKKRGRFSYQGEGWGLTAGGNSLIMSNGTAVITFLNPETFQVIRRIKVRDGKMPVKYLNELEFIPFRFQRITRRPGGGGGEADNTYVEATDDPACAGRAPANKVGPRKRNGILRGEIWANVFTADVIVRISPQTGKVLGWIDLSTLQDLLPRSGRRDVLNGIAYDPERDRIFVTGKFWPKIFEIKIIK